MRRRATKAADAKPKPKSAIVLGSGTATIATSKLPGLPATEEPWMIVPGVTSAVEMLSDEGVKVAVNIQVSLAVLTVLVKSP